jgi:hypothetical protein
LGWYLDYVGRLLKAYPQFSEEFIENELPIRKGWCYICCYLENDGWLQFVGLKPSGDTYLEQEVNNLKTQYYEKYPKNKGIN